MQHLLRNDFLIVHTCFSYLYWTLFSKIFNTVAEPEVLRDILHVNTVKK